MPWRGPAYEGELPTLGYQALDWMAEYLIVPDGPAAGEPLILTDEQALFVLRFYAIDPAFEGPAIRGRSLRNGRRVRRAVLSRAKGWGKSPLLAGIGLLEALGPVVPDGWDADGEPVGRPWTTLGFKAKVQVIAVSEDQTTNTWDPLLEMARNGRVQEAYPIEPMDSFVAGPRMRIEYTTSAAVSREGFRPVCALMDQTESWVKTNGGIKLAAAVRRNLAKVQGSSIESPNAYVPGLDSVAEASHTAAMLQAEERTKGAAGGILLDHREAPPDTDPADEASLREGLAVAYGDSADVNGGWVGTDRLVEDYWDPDTAPADARRFYLNQIHAAEDSWISQPEWAGRYLDDVVADRTVITLGFDGSRARARGVTDATALIGCRVSDGHLFDLGVWEQPDGPAGDGWQVPTVEVEAAVRHAFDRFRVVAFFADPAKWESFVAGWEAKYVKQLKAKSTAQHPIQWWMTGGRVGLIVRALEQFHGAVIDGELTHDGSFALTRHVLNARRRPSRAGLQIGKEHPDSPNKIDAAIAAVLAWQARLAAIAAGVGSEPEMFVPRRIR